MSVYRKFLDKVKEIQVGENYMDAIAEVRGMFSSEEIEIYEKEVLLVDELICEHGSKNLTRGQIEQAFINAGLESVKNEKPNSPR